MAHQEHVSEEVPDLSLIHLPLALFYEVVLKRGKLAVLGLDEEVRPALPLFNVPGYFMSTTITTITITITAAAAAAAAAEAAT